MKRRLDPPRRKGGAFEDPVALTSPLMRGQRVKDAQYLLSGHNRFRENYRLREVDGTWGERSARAANRARWRLGYAEKFCNSGTFGQQLYDFLRTDGNHKPLPLVYQARRRQRLAELARQNTRKLRMLEVALAEARAGVTESPSGSNRVKYSYWYRLIGPWCAMFISWCGAQVGLRYPTAYAYWFDTASRSRGYGLSPTRYPEPGDIVVYYYKQGHCGIFRRWVDQERGIFEAVEGNTSSGSSQDNGGAVLIQTRTTSWARTVFVKVGA